MTRTKKIVTIGCIILIIIVLCIAAVFAFMHFRAGKKGAGKNGVADKTVKNEFYADVEWGSYFDEDKITLKDFYTNDTFFEGDEGSAHHAGGLFATVENYMGDKGVKASITYGYNDKKLAKVTIMAGTDDSEWTIKQLSEKYEKTISKLFGEKDEEVQEGSFRQMMWTSDDGAAELDVFDEYVAMMFATDKDMLIMEKIK